MFDFHLLSAVTEEEINAAIDEGLDLPKPNTPEPTNDKKKEDAGAKPKIQKDCEGTLTINGLLSDRS